MKIHLLRHADAENTVTTDFRRRLSEKGRMQAETVGHFLQKTGETIDLILCSPYERARETADVVQSHIGATHFLEDPRIGCGMAPEVAMMLFREHAAAGAILLVGHQPDLSELAAYLLSPVRFLAVDFRKASLLSFELPSFLAGRGVLQSFIHVRQMA